MSTVSLGGLTISQRTFLRDDSGRFVSEVEAGARGAATELGEQVAALARVFAPKGRGRTHTPQGKRLVSSIRVMGVGGTQADVVADASHAAAQEKGAGPHPIPNAFGSGRIARHPGNPATRFLERAGSTVARFSPAVIRRHMPGLS